MRRLRLAIGRALIWFIEPALPAEPGLLSEGEAEFAKLRELLRQPGGKIVPLRERSAG